MPLVPKSQSNSWWDKPHVGRGGYTFRGVGSGRSSGLPHPELQPTFSESGNLRLQIYYINTNKSNAACPEEPIEFLIG